MRQLPLHDAHHRAGAAFTVCDGVEVPARFTTAEEEYEAARSGAAVVDASYLGKTVFRGPDRREFLHGLVTNDLKALSPGGGVPCCLLTHKGKLLAEFSLYDRGDDFFALHEPSAGAALREGLKKYLPLADTVPEDASDGLAAFAVPGPRGDAVLDGLFGSGAGGAWRKTAWAGVEAFVTRYPADDPAARLVLVPSAAAAKAWEGLVEAGAMPAGFDTLETLRVEKGRGVWGRDLDPEFYPVEAGLERAISYTKGCYLGQETTMRLKTQGRPPRRLVLVALGGPASPGLALRRDGAPAGTLKTVVRSPRRGFLALAVVPFAWAEPGSRFDVDSPSGAFSAEVVLPDGV